MNTLLQQSQSQPKSSGSLRIFLQICFIIFVSYIAISVLSQHSSPTTSNSMTASPATSENSVAPQRQTEGNKKIYATGDSFNVGYTAYRVNDSFYTKQLSRNQFINERPDATYLFVDVIVRNNDRKERMIPPFKLLDENNAEYGTSDKAWIAEGSIGLLHNLNPGVSKRAYVIFDVPTDHTYRLLVSGGYWSTEDALVELAPRVNNR